RLESRAGRHAGRRSAWYLEKMNGGLDAAREMVRHMVVPASDEDRAESRASANLHLLGLADVLRREGAAAQSCGAAPTSGPLRGKRIVVDAGHGGRDSGATGVYRRQGLEQFRLAEKDLTLGVARHLADRLRAAGAEVFLTRDSDETLDLYGRGIAGRVLEADAFVSIHFNYSVLSDPTPLGGRPVDGIDYTAAYVFSPARKNLPLPGYSELLGERLRRGQPAESNRLAGALFRHVSAALGTTDSPPEEARRRMRLEDARRRQLARAHRKRPLPESAMEEAAALHPPPSDESPSAGQLRLYNRFFQEYPETALPKGVRRSDFVVLREVHDKPAVLVETCFIGDRTQLAQLRTEQRRAVIASAVCQGLSEYFLIPPNPR
ncbi:MAG: N-acetylmuramoyl-L-alanine amidase, partial [Candidatus Wallbacteria bacterium]|nr:N-acetylmuramoyl-L-alanine amidase [Candidatus Wallbacteria bacterium]